MELISKAHKTARQFIFFMETVELILNQLNLPRYRLSTGQRSFAFRGAKEYNFLPEYIRANKQYSKFKRKAAAHF